MPAINLPCVLTDHAVLQHSREVPIWGWTQAGALVSIHFRGTLVSAAAGENGRFCAKLPTGSPGGPFELVIQSGEDTYTIHDVLVGEVWLCSGQSNMEWPLRDTIGAAEEIAQAKHPRIRFLSIPQTAASEPGAQVQARWACCMPDTATAFSGVGYHFGKLLHQELDVPIGLIQSAWGGTTAEAWTSREALVAQPDLAYLIDVDSPQGPHTDVGIDPACAAFKDADLPDSDWKTMRIPQTWENAGLNIDGAVWFRKHVEIPAAWAGKPLVLSLGVADDFDQTFFNGEPVGATGMETPTWWNTPRRYTIPANLVRAGQACIAVRVFDQWGDGGLVGKAPMYLAPEEDEQQRIAVDGTWLYRVELALPPRSPASAVQPMSLYNGMISPLVGFTIAGAIWYQGESNVDRAFQYRKLFPTMIECWRKAWNDDFAFLFVLLAGFHAHPAFPGDSRIAELRDAQLATLALSRTAAASAIDLGDIEDIHPRNKHDVGKRLAYAALATCYRKPLEHIGPTFESADISGKRAVVRFSHAKGLHASSDRVIGFAVAGDELSWRDADAHLDGESVVLRSEEAIRFIRYNWADNPLGNLYNDTGLPMLPFRTDGEAYTTAPQTEEYGRLG